MRMGEWRYNSTHSKPRLQMEVSGQLHASAALPRYLLQRGQISPLHFLPLDTILQFISLLQFAGFTSCSPIWCFPVFSFVMRLKCLELFLHSTIRLHGVRSDTVHVLPYTNSLALVTVYGRPLPPSGSGTENCVLAC